MTAPHGFEGSLVDTKNKVTDKNNKEKSEPVLGQVLHEVDSARAELHGSPTAFRLSQLNQNKEDTAKLEKQQLLPQGTATEHELSFGGNALVAKALKEQMGESQADKDRKNAAAERVFLAANGVTPLNKQQRELSAS